MEADSEPAYNLSCQQRMNLRPELPRYGMHSSDLILHRTRPKRVRRSVEICCAFSLTSTAMTVLQDRPMKTARKTGVDALEGRYSLLPVACMSLH